MPKRCFALSFLNLRKIVLRRFQRWLRKLALAMINPSSGRSKYAIYYGDTKLYFEQATDTWIAVGSDDRSDLWINDMPVWQSSNKLKNWRNDEGYRKVHFKKWVNKILFRLENGWQNLDFSLLINTHDPDLE